MEIQDFTEIDNKKIRLVFEKWADEKPIPNLSEFLGVDDFRLESGMFDFYERFYNESLGYPRRFLPLSYHKFDDVYENKFLNFFYFIKAPLGIADILTRGSFPNNVISHLKNCTNLTVVLLCEHESDWEEGYCKIKEIIDINNLNDNQFLFLNNNGNFQAYNRKYNRAIRHHKLNLLSITANSIFSDIKPEFITDKIGKLVLCHNRTVKIHRYAILILLHKYRVIDEVSWSLQGGALKPFQFSDYEQILPKNLIKYCEDEINYISSIRFKESDLEKNKKYFDENGNPSFNKDDLPKLGPGANASGGYMFPEDTYPQMHTYINLVTESQYRDDFNVIHVTEKSFRPFAFYNLPIILATKGHVEYMKKTYGFDFFDDFLNHDYDNEETIGKRIIKVADEVKRLCTIKNDVITFYSENKDRFIRNSEIIRELSQRDDDLVFFKTLMS